MQLLHKLLRTVREYKKTAYHHYGKSFFSLIKFFYVSAIRINTFILFEKDLTEDLPPCNLDPDFVVVTPTLEELENYRKGLDLTREFYYDKIHGVKKCYLVLCAGEIAYIHWIYVKGDPNRFLLLGDGVAELNYNTTIPKFRGKGLMGKMIVYIFHDLKRQGYKKAVGVIHSQNMPAIRSAQKAEWHEIRRIRSMGLFNRKYRV